MAAYYVSGTMSVTIGGWVEAEDEQEALRNYLLIKQAQVRDGLGADDVWADPGWTDMQCTLGVDPPTP